MGTRGVYRGVYSSLPDDPDFQALPAHARLLFYTLRCCAQAGPAAIFRYYPELVMIQAGLTARQLEAAFVALESPQPSGGDPWVYREGVLVWVRNGLRHDPHVTLANPKHRKSVEMAVQALPKQSIVSTYCKYYDLAYPYATQAIPSQSLSLEKKRKEKEKNPPLTPPHWGSVDALVALYNQTAPDECVSVEVVSEGRRTKARTYLKLFPEQGWWEHVFAEIHRSKFLRGLKPTPGHTAFAADLDWLLTKGKDGVENALKVWEGKYRDA